MTAAAPRVGPAAPPVERPAAPPRLPLRLEHLDGLRALAAWFVVVHHIWLDVYPGFPDNRGPWITGWLRWGHLAVAVFIVLSGFSLALSPARNGDRLTDGHRRFIARRAWRLLPPYWVALAVSCVVVAFVTGRHSGVVVDAKAVIVHALLLQDVIDSAKPNGAFWSIAVEWQIYFTFLPLLWLTRRTGPRAMAALTTVLVVGAYLLGSNVTAFEKLLHVTPQFLALFAMGVAAAQLASRRPSPLAVVRRRWAAAAAALVAAGAAMLTVAPSAAIVEQFFWVDLGAGLVTAVVVYALAVGALPRTARALGSRPLAYAGRFSYSTYLLHVPIIATVALAVRELTASADLRLLLNLAVALPLVFVLTRAFSAAFEQPFVQHRSLRALAAAWARRRASADGAVRYG
ncbi:MAG: acyltransferase family protein [Acidimicrobiales bacterium]